MELYLIYISTYSLSGDIIFGDRNRSLREYIDNIKTYFKNDNLKIYNLSCTDNKLDEAEVIENIKRDKENTIVLITSNKNLFTNFYKPITLIYDENGKIFFSPMQYNININNILEDLKMNVVENVTNSIKAVLFNYGRIFNIDIKLLTKETTYKVNNKDELMNMITEDLNLFKFKSILTARLAIVLYRLFYFNLNVKAVGIGTFYAKALNTKSQPYSYKNLNDNNFGFYFKDLINKTFRGYKLIPSKIMVDEPFFLLRNEKIRIAKKLLQLKVKMKIISEALEINEDELNQVIYGETNTKPSTYINIENNKSPFFNLKGTICAHPIDTVGNRF